MGIEYDMMELGVLVQMLHEAVVNTSSTPSRLRMILTSYYCDWENIKKIPSIETLYPGLFCPFDEIPLFINGPDSEDAIIVRWRIELGK